MGELGAVVLDADRSAHEVLNEPDVIGVLTEWWGPCVLGADGQIDRQRVAEIVFEDPSERRRLEALIHPRIFVRWSEALAQCRSEPGFAPAVVIDAPLLFESGLDAQCDVIVFVEVPERIRAQRVQADRGWSPAELQRREKMQELLEAKKARADHVLENNSDTSGLRQAVASLFAAVTSSEG